jgi:Fibrinogen beta and gamma chains, C-terminal globular domain
VFRLHADPVATVMNNTVSIGNQSVSLQSIFGWIIWMRRALSVTFDWKLPWASYKSGFGSIGDSNYWLGLELLSQLTNSSKYRLRIEFKEQSTAKWRSAEYWSFSVGDEATTKYQLNVDGYVEPA